MNKIEALLLIRACLECYFHDLSDGGHPLMFNVKDSIFECENLYYGIRIYAI